MSTSVAVYLCASLFPADEDEDALLQHVVDTLNEDHPGMGIAVYVARANGPTRADFTVYEDTPGEPVAPGLDDIESEAEQSLADALRELAHP